MALLPDLGDPRDPRESRAAWRRLGAFVFIVVFTALAFAAMSVPWIGTEARRAVIGREMLNSLDFVVPTHGGEMTLAKPPFYYWMEAASMSLLGSTRFASRVPTLLLFALLALCVWRSGLRFGRRDGAYATVGALLCLTHPLLGQFAASAELDGSFSIFIALSLFALLRAAQLGNEGLMFTVVSGFAAGIANLIKGPVCLVFLLPAFWPLRKRHGLFASLLWAAVFVLPMGIWLFGMKERGMLDALIARADVETVHRFSFLSLDRLLKIPVDLGKFTLLLLPPLLLPFLGARGKLPLEEDRATLLRALAWSGIGGVLLFCFAPHRPSRYLLPAVIPLVFVLVHGSGPWLDPRARLGLALDRRFDPEIDLEIAKVLAAQKLRWALCGLLVVAAVLVYTVAPVETRRWLRMTPIALLVLAVVVAPWTRGPTVPLLGLGFAVQLVLTQDIALRKSTGERDRLAAAREIALLTGVDSVTGWKHVPSELAWVLDERVILDEFGRRSIKTSWVVWEERFDGDGPPPVPIREVRRRRVDDRDLVLGQVR